MTKPLDLRAKTKKKEIVEIYKIRRWRNNRINNYGNNETLEALLYMIREWEK